MNGVLSIGLLVGIPIGVLIRVPQDQPTIEAALAAATPGDEIVIACGSYAESGLHAPDGVVIRSETGLPDCVTIDAGGADWGLRADSLASVEVRGITFTGASRAGFLGSRVTDVRVLDCRFAGNVGATGAWLGFAGYGVERCEFVQNSGYLGALRLTYGTGTVSDCLFELNAAPTGYGLERSAGALMTRRSDVVVEDSRFERNSGSLGAIAVYGDAVFRRNVFERNLGVVNSVGELDAAGGSVSLEECVFAKNGLTGHPGWVATFRAPVSVTECTFYRNRSTRDAQFDAASVAVQRSVFSLGIPARLFSCGSNQAQTIECSVLDPGQLAGDCATVVETIEADPLFCDPEDGDFAVRSGSPCLPANSPCGLRVGAFGVGCPHVGAPSLEPRSWARVKSLYR